MNIKGRKGKEKEKEKWFRGKEEKAEREVVISFNSQLATARVIWEENLNWGIAWVSLVYGLRAKSIEFSY